MIDALSAFASVIALIISIIALWRAYFVKFKPLILAGSLFFKIFPVQNSGEKWYIPSATATITIANEGARPGAIVGMRLVATYPKKVSTSHYEVFVPSFELDATKNEVIGDNRFSWLRQHSKGHWSPFIVPVGVTITKRLVFETRWENPIVPDLMILSLEIFTNTNKRWAKVTEWSIPLDVQEWAQFSSHNGGINFSQKGDVLIWQEHQPNNLHNLIIYRGPVPASWKDGEAPSFLAYEGDDTPQKEK